MKNCVIAYSIDDENCSIKTEIFADNTSKDVFICFGLGESEDTDDEQKYFSGITIDNVFVKFQNIQKSLKKIFPKSYRFAYKKLLLIAEDNKLDILEGIEL
jgi:hypothetical protein